ncbi:MAG: AI-2E family transporter YdiK [Methylovulum sp.]
MTPSNDLTRTLLAILFICALTGVSLWVIKPFLPALLWATMIVIATWPLLIAVQTKLYNKRWLGVTVMSAVLLLIFVIPFTLAISTIADNIEQITHWGKSLASFQFPPDAPEWVQNLPLIGDDLGNLWRHKYASAGDDGLTKKITPYVSKSATWFIQEVGNFGLLTMQFLLTILISAILYANGEQARDGVLSFGRRLAGSAGEQAITLAAQAIRGVALGVVVTALVQSTLAGLGLWVAGIPFAAVLTALIFMLAIAQLGPLLVLAPAVGWLYWTGDSTWATALLVWSLLVGSIDNILRPVLIKKGADLPLLLIFTGVIGGLIGLGLVGIFIGPVVLAVTYTLLAAWVKEKTEYPYSL